MTSPAAFFLHQSGGFQNAQMLRNGGAAHRKPPGELADRGRLAAQKIEHRVPGRIGKRTQKLLSVSHTLR